MTSGRSRRGARPPDPARVAETRLVYSTAGEVPAAGPPEAPAPRDGDRTKAVRLRLERRASNRLVTVVTGLPGTPAQVAVLARDLRAACGAGGTVRDRDIELQGDQRDKAAAALAARGLRVRR